MPFFWWRSSIEVSELSLATSPGKGCSPDIEGVSGHDQEGVGSGGGEDKTISLSQMGICAPQFIP
jgi:hypothetical protein